MMTQEEVRYIGLDIHKRYLVAYGVNREQEQVYGPRRVEYGRLKRWIQAELRESDAIALEMTTNTWHMVDMLEPHVGSVLVVHPPEVKSIVKARVMTDKKAARILARLHAAKLLPPVWVPPKEVREIRSLVAGRHRMVALAVRAKNALHSVLHTHNITPPEALKDIFHASSTDWWESLSLSSLEAIRVAAELDNISFAQRQKARFELALYQLAAKDTRVPLLAQLPGIGALSAITILGAIGTIDRFPNAQKLVGYVGLGAGVHSSGESHRSGRITKTGRRDLRRVMVDAAGKAIRFHGRWRETYERLEPRIGKSKAKVAIARKMLVAVWHILTKEEVDKYADPVQVACALFALAYQLGVRHLPEGRSAKEFTRHHLDRMKIGREIKVIPWGSKRHTLPPSTLKPEEVVVLKAADP